MTNSRFRPHLPGRVAIDSYGDGGFRFSTMSHRGSLLCLPSGVYAWMPARFEEVTAASLAPILAERGDELRFLLLGTGAQMHRASERLRFALNGSGISLDCMSTGAAARTYNIMLAEGRPVAAALVMVP